MPWHLRWSDRALKDAEHLDRRVRERVFAALDRLAATGSGDMKRLKGEGREWRLRVGDWRVRLEYDHDRQTIEVLRVLPRGRAYRD